MSSRWRTRRGTTCRCTACTRPRAIRPISTSSTRLAGSSAARSRRTRLLRSGSRSPARATGGRSRPTATPVFPATPILYTPFDDFVDRACAERRYGGEYVLLLGDDPSEQGREGCVEIREADELAAITVETVYCADCERLLAASVAENIEMG